MRRLTYADIEAARYTRGTTALLFLTDRCPVGCAHCSVDSRPDSPKISDYVLFEEVVSALCDSRFGLIGISGGEPFVERRGLGLATERLAAAGKDVSIVTSGVWATSADPPRWIRDVIRRCGCLVLSTDVFHAEALPDERFVRAARTIAGEGVWIVVQVIEEGDARARAEDLLTRTFGTGWADSAELNLVPLLPYGRAADLFQPVMTTPGREFGPCRVARSPVIRYDGRLAVCCNESVIMGRGPEALRGQGRDGAEVTAAIEAFDRHALLRAIGDVGPGPLTLDPRLGDLGGRRYRSICELCWTMVDRVGDAADDPLFGAVARLAKGPVA